MEWNFELTEAEALAMYTELYSKNKNSSYLMRAMAAIAGVFGLWAAWRAGEAFVRACTPGFHTLPTIQADMVAGCLLALAALVMVWLCVWLVLRARPAALAAMVQKRLGRRGQSVAGPWCVRLSERQLLISRGGGQEAMDPAVIQQAQACGAGLMVYLYKGARAFLLPRHLFEEENSLPAAASFFERCAALAKARLYEKKAESAAGQPQQALPPCPPLPQGETAAFAVPLMLQQDELEQAFYAANRKLHPVGKQRMTAMVVLAVIAPLESIVSAMNGNVVLALVMGAVALLMGVMLLSLLPGATRGAVKKQLEGEGAQRLLAPGWLVLGQSGFTSTSGALCSYRPYSRLNAVAQNEQYLFLRFERNMVMAVPKRGFESPAQAQAAFAFLQQKQAGKKGK